MTRYRLVGVLGNIDDTRASVVLANIVVIELDDEVRVLAIDLLRKRPKSDESKYQPIFLRGLHSRISSWISNSAGAIAELNATNMVYALIEALDAPVYIYEKMLIDKTVSFYPLGEQVAIGFSQGTKKEMPVRFARTVDQAAVLDALKTLTKQDFRFDKGAWFIWWHAHRSELEGAEKTAINPK